MLYFIIIIIIAKEAITSLRGDHIIFDTCLSIHHSHDLLLVCGEFVENILFCCPDSWHDTVDTVHPSTLWSSSSSTQGGKSSVLFPNNYLVNLLVVSFYRIESLIYSSCSIPHSYRHCSTWCFTSFWRKCRSFQTHVPCLCSWHFNILHCSSPTSRMTLSIAYSIWSSGNMTCESDYFTMFSVSESIVIAKRKGLKMAD